MTPHPWGPGIVLWNRPGDNCPGQYKAAKIHNGALACPLKLSVTPCGEVLTQSHPSLTGKEWRVGSRDQGLNSGRATCWLKAPRASVCPPPKQKASSSRGSWSAVVKSLCPWEREGSPSPGYVVVRGLAQRHFPGAEPAGPRSQLGGQAREALGEKVQPASAQSLCQPCPPTGNRKGCRVTCGICGQTNRGAGSLPREDRKPASESFGCNKHQARAPTICQAQTTCFIWFTSATVISFTAEETDMPQVDTVRSDKGRI